MQRIKIEDIPTHGKYDGYVWMSNATDPIVLRGEMLPGCILGTNPFVVEAQLYDSEKNTSYSIRQAGNETICSKIDLSTAKGDNDKKSYLSSGNSLKGLRLLFLNVWEERTDESCLNMKSLRFITQAFVGFEEENKERD